MRHIITFDVETQYTADEVGGWGNIIDMRLAAAVTYDSASNNEHVSMQMHSPGIPFK